jgi:hypothetical protein
MGGYKRGFRLMIAFTGQRVIPLYNLLVHIQVSKVMSSLAVARQRLPTTDVPLPQSSQTIPGLSYQLLSATVQTEPQQFSNSFTNSTELN